MHIPDGLLSPKVWVPLAGVSTAVLTISVARANRTLADRKIPLMGCMGAFVFAAQMINVPVYAGTSGHLVGGTLLAIVFGPAAACIVMSCILIIQALVFADGGVTALGANIFNMAVVSPFLAYALYRAITTLWTGPRARWTAAFVAAWTGIVVSAAVAGLEISFTPGVPRLPAVGFMSAYHALIGIFEGVITATAVVAIRSTTPAAQLQFAADPQLLPGAPKGLSLFTERGAARLDRRMGTVPPPHLPTGDAT